MDCYLLIDMLDKIEEYNNKKNIIANLIVNSMEILFFEFYENNDNPQFKTHRESLDFAYSKSKKIIKRNIFSIYGLDMFYKFSKNRLKKYRNKGISKFSL